MKIRKLKEVEKFCQRCGAKESRTVVKCQIDSKIWQRHLFKRHQ